MSSRIPKEWPKLVKNGDATVRIYRVENRKATKVYVEFRVVYRDPNGRRKSDSFTEYSLAEIRARSVVATIQRGDAKTLELSADDRLVYLRAVDVIKDTGVPLDVAATEFAQAKKIIGAKSLVEAATFYFDNCSDVKAVLVLDVVNELVELRKQRTQKRGLPASDEYIKDLNGRLGKFAKSFPCSIDQIKPAQIEEFIQGLGIKGRTRHNWLRLIRTLFRFAQTKRYYPRSKEPLQGIETGFDDDGEIEVFTPDEFRRLLASARPEMIPFLTIGGFAGLRSAEIGRLDWADVKDGYIEVSRAKAKTRSRRLVPIQPNLAEWIAPHRLPEGTLIPFANMAKQIEWLCESTGRDGKPRVNWKHNGLRHSFITYRHAVTQNENLVSAEAGNSPAKVHSNYRALATAAQGAEWFGILPAVGADNIVPMGKGVVA